MANPAYGSLAFDRNILENFSILFNFVSAFGLNRRPNDPEGDVLTVSLVRNWPLPLQFPPKITKHERAFTLITTKQPGQEPFVTFKENDGQKLSLEFSYIVEGGFWTGARISSILKKLRSYPITFRAEGTFKNLRVFIPKFWLFGGYDETGNYKDLAALAPFVFESISISHTDTLVADRASGRIAYDKVFPLRTNVSISLLSVDSDSLEPESDQGKEPDFRTPRPVEWQ
jgi:hypothetical protein